MDMEKLMLFYNSNRGGINGALIGFAIACMVLLFGFFTMLFIAICSGIGYYIGKRVSEDKDYLKNLLDKVLPPGTYR